jgi:hypothetical protein
MTTILILRHHVLIGWIQLLILALDNIWIKTRKDQNQWSSLKSIMITKRPYKQVKLNKKKLFFMKKT